MNNNTKSRLKQLHKEREPDGKRVLRWKPRVRRRNKVACGTYKSRDTEMET